MLEVLLGEPDRRNCNLGDRQLHPIKLIQLAWPPPNHWIIVPKKTVDIHNYHT